MASNSENFKDDYLRGGTQQSTYGPGDVVEVNCPLCTSNAREQICTEYGSIGIVKCIECELIYTSPRIREPEKVYWGDGERYLEEVRLIVSGRSSHHRDPNYIEELELIRQYKPKGRFLDVGCNMGMLLRKVREYGWEAFGVEPSPTLSRIAVEQFGLHVYNGFLHAMPSTENTNFDVVALSDVFEHIVEPVRFLQEARRLMKPDGILYVKVPNARWNLLKQTIARRLGRPLGRAAWDSYEHVVHYTDETLRAMLKTGGFHVKLMTIGRPIQVPVWHERVGHYYQYPSPWILDWRRHVGRELAYAFSWPEKGVRKGSIGFLAPNLVAIAKPS